MTRGAKDSEVKSTPGISPGAKRISSGMVAYWKYGHENADYADT